MALHRRGELGRARSLYRAVLEREPDHPRANHLLGILAGQAGDHGAAARLIARAAAAEPSVPEFHLDLGQALASSDRLEAAAASYSRAIGLDPEMAQAHFGLGVVLRKLGRNREAVETYARVVALSPAHAEAHFNLGNALRELGRTDEAVGSFRRAVELRPDLVVAWNNLANALWDTGRHEDALGAWLRALERDPGAAAPRVSFATRARATALSGETGPWSGARTLIGACLAAPCVDPQDLAAPTLSVVGNTRSAGGESGRVVGESREADTGLMDDPLFLGLLEQALVPDPGVEQMLTGTRRRLLLDPEFRGRVPESTIIALALQCHWNEHVFAVTPGEEAAVGRLAEGIQGVLDTAGEAARKTLAVLACYRPLGPPHGGIPPPAGNEAGPEAWRRLLKRHFEDPRIERLHASAIPILGEVSDRVSRKVQAQYQANPYPRWTRTHLVEAQPFPRVLARQVAPGAAPAVAEAPRVLVAGAGTCRHAIDCALSYQGSDVLAVDLSMPGLAYGRRQAEELGVVNIRFLQGDLLELHRLEERFDVIESVGVLHHLEDPWAGLRVLVGLLAEGGVMKLGLYSERGRRAVVAARELISEWGYPAEPAAIRACRQRLLGLDPGHPASDVHAHLDFYHLSGVRDLLFHVQESRYGPAEVGHRLAEAGLEVLGVVAGDDVTARYLERYPRDPGARELANWDRFEADHPDTFREMLQIWVSPAA